jgi:predicted aldo/keto reductase-like oxidoreductase
MAFKKQRIKTVLKGVNNLKKINEKISLISRAYKFTDQRSGCQPEEW